MLVKCFVLAIFILLSACKSDIIPCPEVKALKLKEANFRFVRQKKHDPEAVNASTKKVKRHRDPYLFTKAETLASKMNVEDWDCPKPGTRKKVIKENKKRMEKRIQSMVKKRSDTGFSSDNSATNTSSN